ncbi:hypothetical protein A6M27_16625 [Acidithiobacillus thiooxidans]|uniref:Uncharacterized protein n=1 Tax=Acidithiobacillus thiooxidans TaxID=930 RepID=A0A1C2HVH0_ACITH|nr:hypothetical protein A6O24_20580 [Acidithiobacillus thiooxidans]OCX67810.1 hypothetical protein A6P07_19315 [Acidithiobacillus thiooxidans]OCX84149.1 hypothetical protein A6M27_16625 [Acidithiobacillus thiooxidans]OCX85790.1 hypothetical protein A6O26_00150 [Acidithiobacillus thiooxidans]OFC48523.1 hypothetical protein BAE47_07460 [Acidithiobacillus thiooxidans]
MVWVSRVPIKGPRVKEWSRLPEESRVEKRSIGIRDINWRLIIVGVIWVDLLLVIPGRVTL